MRLPEQPTVRAPDGSDVRVLLRTSRGGFAHFEFPAGAVSQAVRHRSVEEIWYVIGGRGRFWSSAGPADGIAVETGVCLSIQTGESFQVRVEDGEPLAAVAATMPVWPGEGEAELVDGPWVATLPAAP